MNEIFRSAVEINVELHRGFLCLIGITSPTSVHKSESKLLSIGNTEFDIWEDRVNNHSLSKSISDSSVPSWDEVVEGSFEDISKRKSDFLEVGRR